MGYSYDFLKHQARTFYGKHLSSVFIYGKNQKISYYYYSKQGYVEKKKHTDLYVYYIYK